MGAALTRLRLKVAGLALILLQDIPFPPSALAFIAGPPSPKKEKAPSTLPDAFVIFWDAVHHRTASIHWLRIFLYPIQFFLSIFFY
jgi:hypothetical protein